MSLQKALQEHFETALAPQAAAVDGVAMMGFPGLSDATIGGVLDLVQAWLSDALNAGLLPTKPELLEMVADVFDQYIAVNPPLSGRPFLTKIARMGLLAATEALYDAVMD